MLIVSRMDSKKSPFLSVDPFILLVWIIMAPGQPRKETTV